jgi:hypothetical protein
VNAACYPVSPRSPGVPSLSPHLLLAFLLRCLLTIVLVLAIVQQLFIEVYTPGPPRNLTAWYQKGDRQQSQLVHEWPRVGNPWVDQNSSVNATWERRKSAVEYRCQAGDSPADRYPCPGSPLAVSIGPGVRSPYRVLRLGFRLTSCICLRPSR